MNKHYESIANWGTVHEMYNLALKKAKKGDIFVEVGSWVGASVCYLGERAKELKKDIRIHVVDLFTGENMVNDVHTLKYGDQMKELIENLQKQGIDDIVRVYKSYSDNTEGFKDKSVTCVFIDADHSYEWVTRDLEAWFPKMRKGGILCGHDYENTDTAVKKAVHDFADKNDLKVKVSKDQWPCWYFEL